VREGRGNWESIRLGLEAILISNIGQVEFRTIRVSEGDDSLLVTIRVSRLGEDNAITSFNIKAVGTIFLLVKIVSEDGDLFN